MNSIFILLGIESWKPILTAIMLPPVPFLVLILIGARLMLPRRGLGWFVIVFSVLGLWFSACSGSAQLLSQFALHTPPAMTPIRIAELKAQQNRPSTAIVVLGGGLEPYAPEYGVSSLSAYSLERLRYGLWLGRETGLPVAFSGGVGWGQADSASEASIAAQIAGVEFNRPLKWIEEGSRDTLENAGRTIAILKPAGVKHIILVTNGWHMPRALRNFEKAAGADITVEGAPMGLARNVERPVLMWIPGMRGFDETRSILRELLGRLANG